MLVGLRSRKHIMPFELVRAASVADACRVLSRPGRNVAMAGGLDLIDRLKHGDPVDRVVHLAGIRELSGIRSDGDAVSIGACTTHGEIARHALVSGLLPDLTALWRSIANPRVRHTGTLGGNLMSAMPHYDAWPMLLALGASAVVADYAGQSTSLPLSEFGSREGIVLERIRIPVAPFQRRLLVDRSLHPVVSVYLGASLDAGRIHSARVAVGCAYARAAVVELPLAGVSVSALGPGAAALAQQAAGALPEPVADGLASGAYRRRMIEVLIRRLLIKLGSQP